ncbi:MAG: zeta toxin family protein, partial [Prevotella sp.]|nr:zeta toxin family protein [Prevotella sp.]
MANIRRTSDGVYNSLKKISEEEGVDFGLDGMSLEDFKKKYFSSPANTENLYNRLTEISGEEGIDFGQGSREEWMSSFDHKTQTGETLQESIRQRAMPTAPNVQQPNQSQQTEGYKPTAEEKASFNRTLSAGKHTIDSSLQHFDRKADNLRQQQGLHVPPRINVGETNNLQEREELNPETGKVEKTYTTTRGNEYTSKFAAEQEQQQIDAEARSERYQREHPKEALLSRIDGQEKQIEEQLGKQEVDWVDADGRIHYKGGRGGDEAVENLKMAQQDLRQARTRIERSQQLEASSDFLGGVGLPFTKDWFNNWKNFGYGIWDTLKDPSLYDFGLSDLQKAGTYARMKRKMESGEELTDQETALALAGMSLARSQEIAEVPHGYTAGVTTMEMAPFMLQMAANPAGGVGKAFAKKAIKQFGKNGIKAVSARIGARVLGNAAEAAALSNTLQAPATIANIMQRYTGDSFEYGEDGKLKIGHYDTDENGNSVFVEGGKGLARSVWEGEASSIIENFTELGFGGNINKFLGKVAASGMGRRMGLGYISDLVGKVGATPFAKNMKRMMEKTHWDGLLEEPLEEEYGIILNSLLTGDNKISDLWDSDTQADIFAGTMWFGGFMAGMNTAAYPIYKRNIKKQLQQADNNGSMAFGDEWEVMKAGIEEMDDKDVADYLYSIKDNEAFSNDQKAALFAYASRLKQNQGANVADMLMRMEGGLSQENVAIRDAYARGEELTEPQDMNDAKNTYEFQRERLSEIADDNYITHFEEDPVGTMLLIYDNEEWTPEEKQTALDFVNAKMTYQGMLDRVNDDIENQIEVSNATIDRRRNPSDQQIHPATLVDGQQVYIIGGDLVMTDDGTAINRQASKLINGDNMILTVNATTGKVEAHSVEDFLTVDEPIDAEQMKEEARQNIIATMSQEADNKIDGILQFVPGEEYTVADDQGAQHSIQVVADQGDGTVAVYMDGNMQPTVMDKQTIQQMADSYNIGRTQQQMAARVEAQAQPASVNEVYDIEDTVTLQDGQGGTIEGQVVTLPNAVDGVYVVQTNNGKALQLTADELNSRIISHNGVDIQRAEQGADLNNAGGEAGSEQTSANEPPASALSRIPVRMDGDKPVTDRKGRPVREWHKASVEDAAAALVETTGGDMLMARDTAKDLIDQANAKLEKIRKQKPKGEDPLEIAESRMEIKRQEQEQQAIIKQWKDVNQHIQQQMEAESQRKIAEREAAKSEEQRQREAEEARIRKEQQDEQDRQRLREQIERDREKRNKEYEQLTQAKREMAGSSEAMAILEETEPRSLEEWVSSQLRPHSMLWQDASDSETGLQTELGMKRADMQRMMTLLGTKESGAKPFNQIVMEIHEGLPEGMKEQYTDQDVRNTLLNLFNEGSSTRMMHLTEEHRIEEARELMKEMERREAEAEMDAWCEAYHLTPEERETFEDFMQQPPSEPEQEIINNIIIDGEFKESLASSETMDQEPVSGTAVSGTEGGESQVQEPAQSTGNGTDAAAVAQGPEAPGSEPTVSDNQVSGGTPERDAQGRRYVDIKANLKYFFDNIGVENGDTIVDRMSTYELDELLALVEDWETINSEYGEVIEEKTADLKGKDKKKKEAAKKAISAAEEKANEAFVPIEEYVAELSAKYNSPEYEEKGAIPRPKIDDKRLKAIRQKLIDTYSAFLDRELEIDRKELLKATKAIRDYVDEGLDAGDGIVDPEAQDYAEVYDGNDPQKLADEYIVRVFQDRYLDDDSDQEYIKTGLKPNMRFENKLLSYNGKQFEANDNGIVRNPNVIEKRGKGLIGFEIRTALSEKGWSGAISVNGPTYGWGSGVSAASYDKYFETEKECQAYWALLGLQYLEKNRGDAKKDVMLPFKTELRKIAVQGGKQSPVEPSEQLKPTDLRDAVRVDTPEIGVREANTKATLQAKAKGWLTDENIEWAEGKDLDEIIERFGNTPEPIAVLPAIVRQNVPTLTDDYLYCGKAYFIDHHANHHPELDIDEYDNIQTILDSYDDIKDLSENGQLKIAFVKKLDKGYAVVVELSKENDKIMLHKTFFYKDAKGKRVPFKNKPSIKEKWSVDGSTTISPVESQQPADTENISALGQSSEDKGTNNISNIQENLGKTSSAEEIKTEEAKVDTNPSEAQKEAGNYQKGHINIDGYDITIENPKGSVRRGRSADGTEWETLMNNTYGYIRGTEGVDGDHIDVFLSDDPTSGNVYVVDQVNPDTGAFDEHKVMYGFKDANDAKIAYFKNYSKGWKGFGKITEVSREEFKKWVESSHRKTKPFAEYKSVKPAKEHKRLVSDDKMEELRKQLLAKMNNTNVGIDPERMLLGAMYAVGKIERGFTKFADYAQEMVNDLGDMIRPYLKSFYNAVRDMPEAQEYADQMDDYDTVQKFDVFNFDKEKQPDVFTKAEQVSKEEKVKRDTKKVKKEQPDLFAGSLFDAELMTQPAEEEKQPTEQKKEPAAQQVEPKYRPLTEADLDNGNPTVYYQGKPSNVMLITRQGEQTSATTFSKPTISSVTLTNGKSVKLSDLMVRDDVNGKPAGELAEMSAKPKLDKKDYRTYMTPEAREYFAKDPRFSNYAHKELAFIQAAVWDEVIIPVEELKKEPAIVEAEARINAKKGNLQLTEEEVLQYAERLFDKEHGSAAYQNGELSGYTGEVKTEKKAFIVVGRPAGGKSSVFADPISHKYSARIIDSDTVKPWLDGYDEGYGANYVHKASTIVAERALDMAIDRGENVVIPRIGGLSVVERAIELRKKGYDVELLFNDVPEEASIMRAASRFAMKGRYLSLDYLTTIGDKVSIIFSNFVDRNIGDYERIKDEVQKLLRRSGRLPGNSASTREGLRELRTDVPAREGATDKDIQELVGDGQLRSPERQLVVNDNSPIFTHAEWKDNNVPYGTKPVTLWNSNDETFEDFLTSEDNDARDLQQVGEENRRSSDRVSSGQSSVGRSADNDGLESDLQERRDEREGDTGVPQGNGTVSSSTSGQLRPVQGLTQQPAKPRQKPKKNLRNNHGERGKDYAPTSPKARFNANVEAIKLMRELMDNDVENPTDEQKAVLRQYSGWGGLGTFFNDESSAENAQLRDLLTEEEYKDAVMSINSAYYTPATVIDTLWDVAKAMGFKGGNVLEGSAGIGNIIGQMPKDMSLNSDIEAVEIDTISGNILKLLYPDAKVHVTGFQDVVIPNNSVDLAVTNVPFVTGLHVFDKADKDLSRRFTNIHDFCIAKNIRKLREGGIGLFITSSGTLDKSNDLRAWIVNEGQADVVGVFRLNNETFGGTNVTSDIIVVRKRTAGRTSEHAIDVLKASPLKVGTYKDKWGEEHQVSMTINDYFKTHPEMMAGDMAFGYEKGDTFRPGSYGLYPAKGKEQDKMLDAFVKSMEDKAEEQPQPTEQPTAEPNQLTAEKEGRMLVDDKGRLCVSERGQAVPLQLNATKVKGYTKEQCFKDYQEVQQAVDAVLQQQLSDPDDAALKPKLDALNKAFDKFVKRYGTLHKNTAIAFLRNDIDFPSFQALEDYSESKDIHGKVTVKASKTPLFSQRVLGFKTEPKPETVKDAIIASMFRTNGIDLEWIATKLSEVAAPPNGEHWTADDVRKGILVSRLGFENPETGQLEIRYKYLSGNVREKLAQAEAYNQDGRYNTNIEELKKVIPMDIPAHLIDFSLGSSWIPKELYMDYLTENFSLGGVRLNHVQGMWILDEGYGYRNEKNRSAGIYSEKFRETIYGHELVVAALNNRPVKVQKQITDGYGSSKTTHAETDQVATQACAVRVDEIKDEFKQFAKKKIQENPVLAQRIEKIYNEKFNALVPMQIDDEFLPERFDGATMNLNLYGHQKRGVMRGVTAPTMLAHEVGTGKSFTLITTAMEMRRLGTAKKPMIVVQNATVAQITADAKLLYPNAKVLSLSEKDRSAEGRRAFYAKIKFNDWDIIIVPQSTFERIPDSPERELQFIQEKIDEKKHVIEAAQQAGMNDRELSRLKKELETLEQSYGDKYLDKGGETTSSKKGKKKDAKREAASLDKAETKAREQLDRAVDDVQYFDDLGVDALLVDEAHEYKHLGFQTSIGRGIKGIDPSYSKKCAGLYNKTRSVFEKAGWKNVVFATGTPISNTAAEIWTFMKYLMPADVMKANDIYYFDDFVHNFGNISQMLEFSTSGKFKENTRFAAYVNKPELIRIWSQVADTVLTKEVAKVQEKIPEQEGGKDQDIFLPQSPSLIRIMAAVRAELERFENMTGKEKKENSSIPLTMYGIAKRAAIDPRLVDPDAPDEPMSKTNAAVKEIVKDLKATKDYKGTVAVFCDNQNRKGADGSIQFNIYDDMKAKLIKAGIPESQIAIVKSGMSIIAKQKVFDAVNSGDIRVVLGSTQTLGTGVNMQERLHLLIHMDAPDRPMDYTQRNGRIKRQGNLHKQWGKTIRVLRFGVEDSLDVTAYQRLKTKSGFIDSIMDGKGALSNNQVDRTVEEEEEGLFDNPVAVLSGSQYALKKNQAERELRKYQSKKAQWENDQIYVSSTLKLNKLDIEAAEDTIKKEEKSLAHIRSLFPDGKAKTITVEGTPVDMSNEDAYGKVSTLIKEKINDPVNAIVKRNRENAIYNDEELNYTIELDGHPVNFTVSVVRESVWDNGRMRTVIHKWTTCKSADLRINDAMPSSKSVRDMLDEILEQVVSGQDYQDRIDSMRNRIDRLNEESAQLQQRVGMEFQFGKELEEAKKHVEEYTELMKKEMEEKEAKYAAQQKEAQENGGFDLRKADDSEEEEVLARNEEDWDDEGPDSDFKNSEGAIDVDTIKQQAQQMNLGDVEVLTSTDGLSEKISNAKGWFNPKTGKIVIVLPNNKSQQDVFNTLLHEGVAHFGLRKMFGENFDTF